MTKPLNRKRIRVEILRFLESRGRIKAALIYKLESYFCGPKSKFRLDLNQLIDLLFEMMIERIIDIIIPAPFKTRWKQKKLTGLKYFKDEKYTIRTFKNIKSKHLNEYQPNSHYFDSRKIDFENEKITTKWIDHLRLIILKVRDIKKKIIIFYPFESNPLFIYEPIFEGPYKLNQENFRVNPNDMPPLRIDFSGLEQAESIAIMKSYRNKFACFYIPLIEAIVKNIESIQAEESNMSKSEFLARKETEKFAYSCIEFVNSDYVEVYEPNQYRWETFFTTFSIPIKILYYNFEFVEFMENGKIFDTDCHLKYYISIKKEKKGIIKKLKDLGYTEFHKIDTPHYVAIGSDFRYYVPFNSKGISFIYFLSKYVCYYFQFLLFYHAFDYIQDIKPEVRFLEKEKILYKKFLPVMSELFGINEFEIPDKAIFRFYSHNEYELELIFSKYLIPNVKKIELELYKYWLFRFSSI